MRLCYVELPPERIFNRLGIENLTAWLQLGSKLGDEWWTPEVIEIRQEFARIWIEVFDEKTGHFSSLEKSIRESGLLRPVSAVSGPPRGQRLSKPNKSSRMFPPPEQIPIEEVVYTQPFGGSRVTIAQKLNLTVPCAVHDFSNLFPKAPEITAGNFRKWFGNEYTFSPSLPHLRLRKHSHIKNSKYDAMNNHTRSAQRHASRVAREKLGF